MHRVVLACFSLARASRRRRLQRQSSASAASAPAAATTSSSGIGRRRRELAAARSGTRRHDSGAAADRCEQRRRDRPTRASRMPVSVPQPGKRRAGDLRAGQRRRPELQPERRGSTFSFPGDTDDTTAADQVQPGPFSGEPVVCKTYKIVRRKPSATPASPGHPARRTYACLQFEAERVRTQPVKGGQSLCRRCPTAAATTRRTSSSTLSRTWARSPSRTVTKYGSHHLGQGQCVGGDARWEPELSGATGTLRAHR